MLLKYSFAFLKHGSLWTYRVATYAVLVAGLAFVTLVIGLRYVVLPNINDYREPIARAISSAAGQRVAIGAITGSWQGYRPELRFSEVQVFDTQGQPALLLERVDAVISWLSLLRAEVNFHSLEIDEPELEVRRDPAGVLWVAGIAGEQKQSSGGFTDWLLAQRQVVVRRAGITWRDEARDAPKLLLANVNFRLDSVGQVHRFGFTGSPPAQVASRIEVRGELRGQTSHDLQAWRGRVYAKVAQVDLVQAQTWIAMPLELARGLGSLRLWLDLAGTRVTTATAEVRLANVQTRLAPDLPELALADVQGRLAWKQHGDQTELRAESLGFTTAEGLTLAPMRLIYTRSTGTKRHSELRLERLNLAPVVDLAEFLPLDPLLRSRLARSSPAGMIEEAQFSWEGEWDASQPYQAQAHFTGLTIRPDGAIPGFRGVSGQFRATEQGGTVSLNARDANIGLPRVFTATLPLDYMTAEALWAFRDGRTYVTLKNVTFTNEHLAGSVFGSYESDPQGPGTVDVTGTLVRADAHQAWRYMPVTAPITQAWLERALLAGESRDVRVRLKGPLRDFPFADEKTGLFEVVAKVTGVTLDYAKNWPPLTGVVADVLFRGGRMEIRSQAGSALGLRLSEVHGAIPELGRHDERLLVKGVAQGPTSEFLRYVAASPVMRHIDGLTENMKARGDARLDIELDLPLHRIAESKFSGELALHDNQVTLNARVPTLDGFGARIAFTERSVSVKDGRAQLYGSPISFEASNQADGALGVNLAGTLDMAKMRSVSNYPPLKFLEGQAGWRGSLGLHNKVATVKIDSNLVGLASKLPPPFTKSAQASLPLRMELREQPARQQLLLVGLGGVVSAQLLLDSTDADGLRRGMVSFGGTASLPAADGLWVNGTLDIVDVDVWRNVFSDRSAGTGMNLAGFNLQFGILDANGRRFHDLKMDATNQNAAWQVMLSGREIAGQLSWTPAGDGRLNARLTKLVLPAPITGVRAGGAENIPDKRLPSVDLTADSFEFEGKGLGRLSLLADPQPAGWQLRRLEIVNPESNLRVSGNWTVAEASRTDVTVRLEVNDIGKFFTRFGWPEGVKGGSALLEGPVTWLGSPYRLDIPSLSGQLKLEAKNGRFQQIEPGVAKLLGILSLQAIPRRVTLDFRDVFSKGFSFDRISANLNVSAGVAHTEDFKMDGSAASVKMQGQVDLAAETQDLNVRVTPSLSESIAIAGAIVNPAVGLAALIAQKALKDPFSQFAAFDYRVTGTWADPVVTRVNKQPTKEESRR